MKDFSWWQWIGLPDFWNRTWRCLVHIPHGIIIGALLTHAPVPNTTGTALAIVRCTSGVLYWEAFKWFELNSDRHKVDGAWKDLVGVMPGLVMWFLYLQIKN